MLVTSSLTLFLQSIQASSVKKMADKQCKNIYFSLTTDHEARMKKFLLMKWGMVLLPSIAIAWTSPGANVSTRRSFVQEGLSSSYVIGGFVWQKGLSAANAVENSDFPSLLIQVQQARKQLDSIPALIDAEKWDSVRAILIEPPLADCWAKTSRPLLTKYAEGLGDSGGDELAALEAREDLIGHLRYLDMAVYNNVFNPITVEGKSGATKELIRSYYEDPINEFKASLAAMEELIRLSKEI